MRRIRYFVFETNSSSTHSLTLELSDRKFTRVDKLLEGKSYTHKLMGEKKNSSDWNKRCKYTYSSEYDKLCVLFDMLFMHFYTQFFNLRNNAEYLEQYRKRKSEDNGTLYFDYSGYYFDFLEYVKMFGFRTIEEAVEKIVFDSKYIFSLYSSCSY